MKKNIKILLFIIPALSVAAAVAQIKPRVAGLEGNTAYIELLAKEQALRGTEDSLNSVVSLVRVQFREQPDKREFFRNEILRLEGEIFDVRNEAGIVAGKINLIEQEFIMSNLDKGHGILLTDSTGGSQANEFKETSADLVKNELFRLKLPAGDYASLLNAQAKETPVANYLSIYRMNYGKMSELAKEYRNAANQTDADSLMRQYDELEKLAAIIEDSVSNAMNYIFDNKTYAYNYLLDRLNMMDVLAEFEKKSIGLRDEEVKAREKALSGTVATYPIRKKLLFDYEKLFASHFGMSRSLDSLKKAEAALNATDYSVPRLDMTERLFLDYADIEIHSPAKYNASNPVPQCTVYEKGVIYRVLVGTYTRTQPVSVFKGVYPLGYIKGDDNRYRYYAGGFDSRDKAEEAAKELKKHGIREPKVVFWDYGVYALADEPQKSTADNSTGRLFRVEIDGAGDRLPDAVSSLLREQAEGKDILRVGSLFFVSSFGSAADAERVAEAVRAADRKLTVKISEIPL